MNTRSSKILVVDEDEQVRKLLRTVLTRAGYRVQTSHAAKEGIKAFAAAGGFDVVVSETDLSHMDGHQFVREVAERWPNVRVVFVSASGSSCDGCPLGRKCTFLGKPFAPREVVRQAVKDVADVHEGIAQGPVL